VGQLLWWVNHLLKQSVPTRRPISFHAPAGTAARGAPGILFAGQKLIDLSPESTATFAKKAILFILPRKKRIAESEFLCAHKQL
jgi:hypothetical protein